MAAEQKAGGPAESAGAAVHCPHCGRPVGEACDHLGERMLRAGNLIVPVPRNLSRIRVYCAACRQPRHWRREVGRRP